MKEFIEITTYDERAVIINVECIAQVICDKDWVWIDVRLSERETVRYLCSEKYYEVYKMLEDKIEG